MHRSTPADDLVSVVMCTYNGEQYLSAQMNSILSQSYRNIEVIVCDDASTDNTPNILAEYAVKDPRIKVSVNAHTTGIKQNFTNALKLAAGNWIAVADQDDIWMEHKLKTLLDCVMPGVLLVHSYNAEFPGNEPEAAVINRSRIRFSGNDTRKLFFYNTVYGHTIMVSKLLLEHARPFPTKVFYDWWLGLIASVHGKVALSNEVLVKHRIHASNSSRYYIRNPGKKGQSGFFQELNEMLAECLSIDGLAPGDKQLLQQYRRLIASEWTKWFSMPMFLFLLKHAPTTFYYRRKKPMFFYYLKYSFKKATMQIKHWS
ncbi:glycosyltransferase [Segetibacter sp. 3557_3]|uniref:glycosyltransferase n=1 Tax=Segetibacter sp. 3557_3 TaxID=2547429 RepID=UPI0010583EAF|nr:glycosyltransferase [Segetibacter sp. 3557_3]TDH20883.1 glycosyltransferase [Segetibacter sp. 3557_3]